MKSRRRNKPIDILPILLLPSKLIMLHPVLHPLRLIALTLTCFCFPNTGQFADAKIHQADVVVYGGTSGAVIAAVETAQSGKSVLIVCPDKHLGGLTSGGLGWTDTGNKAVIGGLARDFYHRVWQFYDNESAWKWQTRSSYGNKGQGNAAIDGSQRTQWIFEPHVAEAVFEDYVTQYKIPVYRDQWLDRKSGVKKNGTSIESITMTNGDTFVGKVFIDGTYEGDLMAAAGVDYHVGRESTKTYDEKWNGVQTGVLHHRHHFGVLPVKISPYKIPDDPTSGLLPMISPDPPGEYGSGDHRVQAYCFRLCMTDLPENRVPFPKPKDYDPANYELLGRVFDAGWREMFDKFDPIPNRKTDTNNHGPFSSDYIGFNYDYPEASYQRRAEIIDAHRRYQQGLLYFMANDPRVPEDVRKQVSEWGLAADEFKDNDNWPHQIYVREARRMIGRYVMTENELLKLRPTPESIGMGSYTIDSHNVQRYVTPEGYVQNEGDIGVSTSGPYQISLGSIQPIAEQATNLIVPVAVSSSHIAFGSIRMEPVFMILGQSAGALAVLAIDRQSSVQDVPYEILKKRLVDAGQVLEYESGDSRLLTLDKFSGVVVDDEMSKKVGNWISSTSMGKWIHRGYVHDGNPEVKEATIRFETPLPASGSYEVGFAFPHHANRATNVKVTVLHAEGESVILVNQKLQSKEPFTGLGVYPFDKSKPAAVVISNEGADGYVVADAVQFLAVQP
jgi:hypothetical protein